MNANTHNSYPFASIRGYFQGDYAPMPDLTLNAARREVLGKKVARLRRAGITPANIYGHNVESTAIQLDTHDLTRLVRQAGRTALITLIVGGEREPRNVIVRDVSRKPTTDEILHVDFMQVSMREKLTVSIPLVFTGHAPVLDTVDAVIIQNLDSLQVECLPGDIPQHIDVDLSAVTDTTSVIHVRDLVTPPNVTVLNEPDTAVVGVTVRTATAEEQEAAAEARAAEEVPTVGETEEGAEERE